MLADNWGAATQPDATLRAYLDRFYPWINGAVESYRAMYPELTYTNAVRFVVGSTGDGLSAAEKSRIVAAAETVEAGMPIQFGGSGGAWQPVSTGAGSMTGLSVGPALMLAGAVGLLLLSSRGRR